MYKGINTWANTIANKLKTDPSTFDKIFSKEEGVFPLDKLSKKEVAAISKALGEIKEDSLEIKNLKTFFLLKSETLSKQSRYNAICNLEKQFNSSLGKIKESLSNQEITQEDAKKLQRKN